MQNHKSIGWLASFTAIMVIVVWGMSGWWLYSDPDRGTFGDMFGAVNALFSGLAFVGVIYAIMLQREELKLQRQDNAMTREELSGQKNALQKQNFESTFFQMTNSLNHLISSIDLVDRAGNVVGGRDAIGALYEKLKAKAHTENKTSFEAYEEFYKKNGHELGHYFRYLYNIFKYIDTSEIDNKRFYSNLARAQMSDIEVVLLFYNSLSERGERFQQYIVKYGLFKFLNSAHLINFEDLDLYEDPAYDGTLNEKRSTKLSVRSG
jgi:hypothetical protein